MTGRRPAGDATSVASAWFALFESGEASEQDYAAWRAWCAALPSHQAAWDRVEQVRAQMAKIRGGLAPDVLSKAGHSRRRMLRTSALVAVTAPLAYWIVDGASSAPLFADYRTRTGERRDVRLPDGSLLSMNTATALDMRFDIAHRDVTLREGEIVIAITPGPTVPLNVHTEHGTITTQAARMAIRLMHGGATVSVFAHAAEIAPANSSPRIPLAAGQQLFFDRRGAGAPSPVDDTATAWLQGRIVALDMPLSVLLGELSRYRRGFVRCAPEIAGLKVSGAFPVSDTDQALAAIERSFPVRVDRLGPWWVSVEPA